MGMGEETRTCLDCRLPKVLDDFYVKRVNSNGPRRYARCKLCHNRWTYRKHGKTYVKRDNVRERELARDLLKKAVKHGRIIKPAHCEGCGQEKRKQELEAHHHDYAKPFDVVWLCRPCHRRAEPLDVSQNRKV
jgi:hypothetical protein